MYVANHQSFMDIYSLFHLQRPFKFISKTSNFLIPIVGWSMFLTGGWVGWGEKGGWVCVNRDRVCVWVGRGQLVIAAAYRLHATCDVSSTGHTQTHA